MDFNFEVGGVGWEGVVPETPGDPELPAPPTRTALVVVVEHIAAP